MAVRIDPVKRKLVVGAKGVAGQRIPRRAARAEANHPIAKGCYLARNRRLRLAGGRLDLLGGQGAVFQAFCKGYAHLTPLTHRMTRINVAELYKKGLINDNLRWFYPGW